MSTQKFTIEIEQEQRWIAEVVELPWVMTYGSSPDDAKAKVQALALRVEVAEPRLWWPWDLGDAHLYSLDLSVRAGERVLDRVTDRIGLRQVSTESGASPARPARAPG